jgi:hypothetical protein
MLDWYFHSFLSVERSLREVRTYLDGGLVHTEVSANDHLRSGRLDESQLGSAHQHVSRIKGASRLGSTATCSALKEVLNRQVTVAPPAQGG